MPPTDSCKYAICVCEALFLAAVQLDGSVFNVAYLLNPLLNAHVYQTSRKCTRIEIHLLTPQGLQPMLDVPIYGRVTTLELFRPHVLLATGGGHPVYLQIRDAKLVEVKHVQLEHEISCVDLNPIGENPQYSYLAAVGMWTDITVRIFSLTDLELIRKETLGGETLAFCSFKYNQNNMEESETHFVRLLDHQTFEFMSTHPLDQYECGCPIVSCSFLDDNNVFYCVGTAYILPEENEPTKGRILVFAVEDGRLQLIVEKEIKGVVYSLNAFIGKLLAAINQKIRLYKWMLL